MNPSQEQSVDPRKPRLWFVTPSFLTSTEVWMYRQAAGIRRLAVEVLTKQRTNADLYPDDGFTVQTSGELGSLPRSVFLRYLAFLANFRHGFFPGSRTELKWWQARFRESRPDILLCQYGFTAARMLPLAREFGVPLVAHFHGVDFSSVFVRKGYAARLRWALPRFDGVVVVGEFQHRWMLEQGVEPDRVRLIPCGVPIDEFAFASQEAAGPCRFLAVGRLVPKKAPEILLRAFARCVEEVPDCELRIIGDGPMLPQCQELAATLKLGEKVSFLGSQPNERVKQEMRSASVFVQHSVTTDDSDMEGWPVAIAEACASRLPVVSTRHAGIVDQIDEEQTGFLVDEGDWQQMGVHMAALARDAQLRQRMGEAARRKIERFDTQGQIAKLEAFLLECLQKRKSS
jgi:glycosyltransferase involved in cell wall biosynthesis